MLFKSLPWITVGQPLRGAFSKVFIGFELKIRKIEDAIHSNNLSDSTYLLWTWGNPKICLGDEGGGRLLKW